MTKTNLDKANNLQIEINNVKGLIIMLERATRFEIKLFENDNYLSTYNTSKFQQNLFELKINNFMRRDLMHTLNDRLGFLIESFEKI